MALIKLPIILATLLFTSISVASVDNCPPTKPDCVDEHTAFNYPPEED